MIPAATFTLSNAAAGTIDNTGKFTAGTSDGVYIITIINKLNAKDIIRRMVIVIKHAAYLIV